MAQHADLEVVDHDFFGHAAEELEGMAVAGEELLHALGQGELDVQHPAVTEHHDKEAQAPAGRTDGDRTEAAPVHLGAFARGKLQHQEGGLAHRAHQPDELLEDAVAAGVALRLELLQELLGGVGVAFQQGDDLALEESSLLDRFALWRGWKSAGPSTSRRS